MLAHQYLTPLDLNAISPYGWTDAIDAYESMPLLPSSPIPGSAPADLRRILHVYRRSSIGHVVPRSD
jgi:hypothetical protein